jgi:hypothetical protein
MVWNTIISPPEKLPVALALIIESKAESFFIFTQCMLVMVNMACTVRRATGERFA